MRRKSKFFFILFIILHIAGFLTSVRAIMDVRTSQGAVAWAISLNTFPSVSLPAYWILGNSKFSGYVTARRTEVVEAKPIMRQLLDDFIKYGLQVSATEYTQANFPPGREREPSDAWYSKRGILQASAIELFSDPFPLCQNHIPHTVSQIST